MLRCPPGSLRSVQLPLDHLVEKRDRAVCHRRSNGRRSQSAERGVSRPSVKSVSVTHKNVSVYWTYIAFNSLYL